MKDLNKIKNYYDDKIEKFGATAQGVDWNSQESQYERFKQLTKILSNQKASIVDLGCGYAELYDYLRKINFQGQYHGIDISNKMIAAANSKFNGNKNFKATIADKDIPKADFVLASGIFSVKLNSENEIWLQYIYKTIENMFASCNQGIAFNCLTTYSDKEKMRNDLYYASPEEIFSFCKKHISKEVALLHDYGLYEFTVHIRRDKNEK